MSETDFAAFERNPARRHDDSIVRPSPDPLHALQTAVGNNAVARMLQRAGGPEEEPVEEDTVAAKHDPALAQRAPLLAQRAPTPEVGMAGGGLSDSLAGRINSQRGGGSALDSTTKTTMESTLGTSLDGVRVHVGQESDLLNQSITAKAFTTGNDVFIRSDHWAPGSSATQRLMAHELTHVVQQRSTSGSGAMSVGASDTAEEHEAVNVAEHVMQRAVQREVEEPPEDV